jgi:hypothetical protein
MTRIATPVQERVYDVVEDQRRKSLIIGVTATTALRLRESLLACGKKTRIVRQRSRAFDESGSIVASDRPDYRPRPAA